MAKLFGAQKLVLQAIHDSPKDEAGFVIDTQVAQATSITLNDVRDWIETLEGEGHVEVARTTTGLSTSITAKGRLALGQYKKFLDNARVVHDPKRAMLQDSSGPPSDYYDDLSKYSADFSLIFDRCLSHLVSTTGAYCNQILALISSGYGQQLVVVADALASNCQRYRIASLDGLLGTGVAKGKILIANDVGIIPDYFPASPSTRSELVVPVTNDGFLVGMFNSESETRGHYDDTMIGRVSNLASALGRVLAGAGWHSRQRINKLPWITRDISTTAPPSQPGPSPAPSDPQHAHPPTPPPAMGPSSVDGSSRDQGKRLATEVEGHRALRRFLADAFTRPELDRFLKEIPIPPLNPNVGDDEYFPQVVDVLDRRGWIHADLFHLLSMERPAKRAQIKSLSELVLGGPDQPTAAPAPNPDTGPLASPATPPHATGNSGSPSALRTGQSEPGRSVTRQPVRLFYSYSHEDERLLKKLEQHLKLLQRQGFIAVWHDRMIGAGEEWKGAIDKNLDEAQVVLLLVSSSFLASNYCYDVEMKRAIERHDRGEASVIPVILRKCDWHNAPFGELQALPKDGRAVTSWRNRDEAWTDVTMGIRRAAEAMISNPQ
jgi:putative methionine-R-sulfoxide reductase with GAF domain